MVLAGIVITVQGFETVRYLGDEYDAPTRVRASRWAQLVASVIYIGFVAVATPVMGLGTSAGTDSTLLDITGRIAPWLAIPLVLSAVLSQFSAAIADTAAADGNLRGLSRRFRGRRAYLISGVGRDRARRDGADPDDRRDRVAGVRRVLRAAGRDRAAYRDGIVRKVGFGLLALLMLAIAVFAAPAG